MLHRPRRFVVVRMSVGVVLAAAAMLAASIQAAGPAGTGQEPTFRSSVDVIVVDVQVVDKDGTPVVGLGPESFEVQIAGHRRRVVSADHVRSPTPAAAPALGDSLNAVRATNLWPAPADQRTGRIYILALDVGSLSLTDSRAVVGSAQAFINRLLPEDRVGLFVFPLGALIDPTTDHAGVKRSLNTVTGTTARGVYGRFHLSTSEIIDITAEAAGDPGGALDAVLQRECGGLALACSQQLRTEAQVLSFYLEGRATQSLNGMRALIDLLGEFPGRKTVVVFSSGIPTSDRPGGRPDVGNLPRLLGQSAAVLNTAIYTLFIDSAAFQASAAETRRLTGTPLTRSRDHLLGGRAMQEFTGASGGAFMRILNGSSELALDRVLRETSAYYLLGVEPDRADRDGRLRALRVKVAGKGLTVRSRMWVAVPKAP